MVVPISIKSLLAVGTVGIALTACSASSGSNNGGGSAHSAIVVAGVLDLTGDDAGEGLPSEQGLKIAFDQINAKGGIHGRQIRLVADDAGSSPQQAVALATKLASDSNVLAIVGPAGSNEVPSLVPVVNQIGIPLVSATAIDNQIVEGGPWGFMVRDGINTDAAAIGKFMAARDYKRVAFVYPKDNPASVAEAKIVQGMMQKQGAAVKSEPITMSSTNFATIGTALKGFGPQAVYCPCEPTLAPQVQRQLRQAGIPSSTQFYGDFYEVSPAYYKIAGSAANGTIFSTEYNVDDQAPMNRQFVKAYKQKFGDLPRGESATGYTAGEILINAFERAGTNPTRKSLLNALNQIRSVRTVLSNGVWTRNAKRDPTYPLLFAKLENGKFVPIKNGA